MRNSNSLLSEILTRLIRFTSSPRRPGPSTHLKPRLPTCPGEGFTEKRTTLRVRYRLVAELAVEALLGRDAGSRGVRALKQAGGVRHSVRQLGDFPEVFRKRADDIRSVISGGNSTQRRRRRNSGVLPDRRDRRQDAQRRSRSPAENSAELPALDHALQESGSVGEELLSRPKRQNVRAVAGEIVGPMVIQQRFVGRPVSRIPRVQGLITVIYAYSAAPVIRCLTG